MPETRNHSGIYPHLAILNQENECGTGAVVPWADRLWVISYAPHRPQGSSDKLDEITPSQRPVWLRVGPLLGEYGIPRDSPAGRRRLEAALEARRAEEQSPEFQAIRRGWCLGEEGFRHELLAEMSQRLGPEHYGPERA